MARTPGQTIGMESQVDVSIVEAKVLKIMRTKQLGIGIAATSQNPTQHKAGLAIYRVPELVQSQDYTYDTRNDDPDKPGLKDREVLLNKKRTIKYELETFDLSVLELEGSINSEYAAGITTAMLGEMDAEFIETALAAAIALGESTDNGKTGGYIINNKYSTARTTADLDTMFFDTVDLVAGLEGTVDREQVGVDKDEAVAIVGTGSLARFIKGGNGGDSNNKERATGMIQEVNGIALRVHPFIGKAIAAGTSFSKDKDYDFSVLENLTVHTEAVAMPFAMNSVIPTTGENSGNPKIIAKYRYGVGVVRPALVRAILNVAPTPEAKAAAEALVPDAAKIAELNLKAKEAKKSVKGGKPTVQADTTEQEATKEIKDKK